MSPGGEYAGEVAGVVFDLGNVLISYEPAAAVAAGLGADEARRFLAAEDFDFFEFNVRADAGRSWDEGLTELRRTHPHWVAHATAYAAHYPHAIRDEVPGTPDLVRDLHRAGVPLWCLTNFPHEFFPHALERHDFLALFDGIVVSGTERLVKPDPRIYRLVADRSGLPLDRLVFIDDTPANVAGAAEVGMRAIRFIDAGPLRNDLRDLGLPV